MILISVPSRTLGEDGYVSDAAVNGDRIQHLEKQISLLNELVDKLKVEVKIFPKAKYIKPKKRF